MTLATDHGFPLWLADATILWGWALAKLGGMPEGTAQMCQGLAAIQGTGSRVGPYYLAIARRQHAKSWERRGEIIPCCLGADSVKCAAG
jgi:predicted ATPase